jgi:methylamine--corrinoid protein Co-methyltransferase
MSPKEFDMKIFNTVTDIIKEHKITYDQETFLLNDDSIADEIFQAGLELFLKTGMYCTSSERCILFDESEIKQGIKDVSSELFIGDASERKKIIQRKPDDNHKPIIIGGVIESNPSEEIYLKLYQTIAQEKVLDGTYFGPPQKIEGINSRTFTPLEIHAARCGVSMVRQALRMVGRPGFHLIDGCPSAVGSISSSNSENGTRNTDAIALAMVSELRTDYETLNKVIHSFHNGLLRNPYWVSMIGGWGGGPEGIAILGAAHALAAIMVYQVRVSGYALAGCNLISPAGCSNKPSIWSRSAMIQAITRNTPMITGTGVTTLAGPGTEMMLWEIAAVSMMNAVSGGHVMHGARKSKLTLPNQGSGLEPKFMGEVSHASASLKRNDVNELLKKVISKYEEHLTADKAPEGKSFEDLYDINSLKPKNDYLRIYDKVNSELRDIGLPIN